MRVHRRSYSEGGYRGYVAVEASYVDSGVAAGSRASLGSRQVSLSPVSCRRHSPLRYDAADVSPLPSATWKVLRFSSQRPPRSPTRSSRGYDTKSGSSGRGRAAEQQQEADFFSSGTLGSSFSRAASQHHHNPGRSSSAFTKANPRWIQARGGGVAEEIPPAQDGASAYSSSPSSSPPPPLPHEEDSVPPLTTAAATTAFKPPSLPLSHHHVLSLSNESNPYIGSILLRPSQTVLSPTDHTIARKKTFSIVTDPLAERVQRTKRRTSPTLSASKQDERDEKEYTLTLGGTCSLALGPPPSAPPSMLLQAILSSVASARGVELRLTDIPLEVIIAFDEYISEGTEMTQFCETGQPHHRYFAVKFINVYEVNNELIPGVVFGWKKAKTDSRMKQYHLLSELTSCSSKAKTHPFTQRFRDSKRPGYLRSVSLFSASKVMKDDCIFSLTFRSPDSEENTELVMKAPNMIVYFSWLVFADYVSSIGEE